jgi:uncharacterized protein YjbI with pentapeptide repeats
MNIDKKLHHIKFILKAKACRLSVLTELAGLDKSKDFSNIDLSGIRSDGPDELVGYNFNGSNLSNVDFSSFEIISCSFVGANLKGASFNSANLINVDFKDAILTNINFNGTSFNNG